MARAVVKPGQNVNAWAAGRWGPRRVRVTECAAVLTAEGVYTELLRSGSDKVRPWASGTVMWTVKGVARVVRFCVRPNAIWPLGRVFLTCSRCGRLVTRIYLPTTSAPAACRECFGLSYEARTLENYRDTGLFASVGITHRTLAERATDFRRARRRSEAQERRAARRTVRARRDLLGAGHQSATPTPR